MKQITIAGAGLAGCLLAIYLARRGYTVDIIEARDDIRKNTSGDGRSINLALSCRGITGLTDAGIMDSVRDICVPMRARAIHEPDGSIQYQPFGRNPEEYINSISRKKLNMLLLDTIESTENIQLYFGYKIQMIDFENKSLKIETSSGQKKSMSYHRLIGADGAPSSVRESMVSQGIVHAERKFLSHGYKEICIASEHTNQYAREHLHLWPRGAFMLLGNPNPDDSITGSLFLARSGKDSFESLHNESELIQFFKKVFPDTVESTPDLIGDFFNNPTGSLSTVHCTPWNYRDDCLLIGDSAHGIVPFFGQGMNCAFEDCRILNVMLEKYDDDWSRVIPEFYRDRKRNTDAVAELSMENYQEIQSDIRSPQFLLKKKVERLLMERYPEKYVSMHIMVMFTNVPYSVAQAHGNLQKRILDEICLSINRIEEVKWEKVEKIMSKYDENLTNFL